MKSPAIELIVGMVIGAILTFLFTSVVYNKEIVMLKARADSISADATSKVAAESIRSAETAREVGRLRDQKRVAITAANSANAKIDTMMLKLAYAETARDSMNQMREMIDSFQHSIVPSLFGALARSDSMFEAEHNRAGRLAEQVVDLNRSIQVMVVQINKLSSGPPKWLKIGTEIAKDAAIFVAGFEAAKRL